LTSEPRTWRILLENQLPEGHMDPGFLSGFPCSLQPRHVRVKSRLWKSILY